MARQDYTPHQQNIISHYYRNLDTIMLAKLQELVSELYLVDSKTKQERLWKRVGQAITKLRVPVPLAEHILTTRNVEVLAANLQDWLKKANAGAAKR